MAKGPTKAEIAAELKETKPALAEAAANVERLRERLVMATNGRAIQRKRFVMIEERFVDVLTRILNHKTADPAADLAHFRLLAASALGGTKVGGVGWAFTARLLTNAAITSMCAYCGINCYGAAKRPSVMPCNIPGCPYEAPVSQAPLSIADGRRFLTMDT